MELRWNIVDEPERSTLSFEWIESDGPSVVAPTRRGFGAQLLERVLTQPVGAETHLNYLRDGLHADFRVPLPKPSAALTDQSTCG